MRSDIVLIQNTAKFYEDLSLLYVYDLIFIEKVSSYHCFKQNSYTCSMFFISRIFKPLRWFEKKKTQLLYKIDTLYNRADYAEAWNKNSKKKTNWFIVDFDSNLIMFPTFVMV